MPRHPHFPHTPCSHADSCHPRRNVHSFPTRRSSDLAIAIEEGARGVLVLSADCPAATRADVKAVAIGAQDEHAADRKSTRLNSSHTVISYAVFCVKKNK